MTSRVGVKDDMAGLKPGKMLVKRALDVAKITKK
jgi:hypothetical protein